MDGYKITVSTEDAYEKIMAVTTDQQKAAEIADTLREEGYNNVTIQRYK